jgi:predicted negative regulator of RcsB-dependent stress response
MDNEVKRTADLYRLVAWAHARRKQLIWISAIVVVAGALAGIYVWHKNYNESLASETLSQLPAPSGTQNGSAGDAAPYVKLANDFSGTGAAARALLIAGGIFFDGGKFADARTQFERFLQEYGDSPLASQAALGIAACLEAEGKTAEAVAHYNDFVNRHSTESVLPQAKSALARLYVAENKPEQAFELYRQLAQVNNQDSWSAEAGIQAEELLQKYPELRKKLMPPASHAPSSAPTLPSLNLPKK